MSNGNRFEDVGVGKILRFWPFLVALFTAGAWYQSALTEREITSHLQSELRENTLQIQTDSQRITRMEDAVLYLKQIVESDRRHRRYE